MSLFVSLWRFYLISKIYASSCLFYLVSLGSLYIVFCAVYLRGASILSEFSSFFVFNGDKSNPYAVMTCCPYVFNKAARISRFLDTEGIRASVPNSLLNSEENSPELRTNMIISHGPASSCSLFSQNFNILFDDEMRRRRSCACRINCRTSLLFGWVFIACSIEASAICSSKSRR